MSLLENWRVKAYGDGTNDKEKEELWKNYFQIEKGIYEKLLADVSNVESGTVSSLAEKFGTTVEIMTGFLDGINDSLKEANPIETMEEDTEVSLLFDKELLYKNMVAAQADWLYGLEEWNDIFSEEKQKELVSRKSEQTVKAVEALKKAAAQKSAEAVKAVLAIASGQE